MAYTSPSWKRTTQNSCWVGWRPSYNGIIKTVDLPRSHYRVCKISQNWNFRKKPLKPLIHHRVTSHKFPNQFAPSSTHTTRLVTTGGLNEFMENPNFKCINGISRFFDVFFFSSIDRSGPCSLYITPNDVSPKNIAVRYSQIFCIYPGVRANWMYVHWIWTLNPAVPFLDIPWHNRCPRK